MRAFEHAATGTLARTGGHTVQVIRNGLEVARFPCELSASASRDGQLLLDGKSLIDLGGRFPQKRRQLVLHGELADRRAVLHPDGDRLLVFRDTEIEGHPSGKLAGLLTVTWDDLRAVDEEKDYSGKQGRAQILFAGDFDHPARIPSIFKIGAAPKKCREEYGHPDWPLRLSSDGKTWALVDDDRFALGQCGKAGKAGKLLSYVSWRPEGGDTPSQEKFDTKPMTSFDLEQGRLVYAGSPGIVAFDFDGRVAAFCKATDEFNVVSPVVFWNDMALAVCYHYDEERDEVRRFDRKTLRPLGRLEDFEPMGRSNSGLLPLADGSLAWVPSGSPIQILPKKGVTRSSTELVQIAGGKQPEVVPAPKEPWYDAQIGESGRLDPAEGNPGQRRSLARYLLEKLNDGRKFDQLMKIDPAAFSPYRDLVLGWPEERLRRLAAIGDRFDRVAVGASDEVVTRVAEKLQKKFDPISAKLLLSAETPHSLELIGTLARKSKPLAELCQARSIEVPKSGPALLRYSPSEKRLAKARKKADPRLATHLPPEKVMTDSEAWSCRAPLRHLLTVELSLLPQLSKSPLEIHPWLISGCQNCNDSSDSYEMLHAGRRRVAVTGTWDAPRRPKKRCPGDGSKPSKKPLALGLAEQPSPNDCGQIGGRPRWTQSPTVPDCPKCRRMMFFVGMIYTWTIRDDVPTVTSYGFHCERCGTAVNVVQVT
jgi:hypothetical protein